MSEVVPSGPQFLRIRVLTRYIEDYPELFEAYKRQMADAIISMYGQFPDWDHFTVHHGRDEPFCTDEEKPYSWLVLWSKEEA